MKNKFYREILHNGILQDVFNKKKPFDLSVWKNAVVVQDFFWGSVRKNQYNVDFYFHFAEIYAKM